MDPSGNSNGGPSGGGDPSRNTSTTTNNNQNDLSQSLESNSSFDSDIPPSSLPESKNKKRRKQSRPSRIPDHNNRDSDLNPLNLSKGSSGEGSYFLSQPSFAALFPNLPEISGSGGSGGSHGSSTNSKEHGTSIIPPNRIFNPEAYCDLCNKEFCNKYFLKTHKANKHGVYCDTPPTNGSYLPQQSDPAGEIGRRQVGSNGQGMGRHGTPDEESHQSGDNEGDEYNEDEGGFSCHFCGSEFPSEVYLRNHLGEKHGLLVPPFLLPFPPATPPSSLFDLPKNSPSEAFDCSRCSRSFSTLYLLRMHTSYFHPPTPPPNNNNNKEEDSIKEECLSPEETGETTSDSDELRRLQSMILDLNPPLTGDGSGPGWNLRDNSTPPLPPNATTTAICPVCGKECYSTNFLAQHMEQNHGGGTTSIIISAAKDDEAPKSGSADSFLLPTANASGNTASSSLKGERRPSPSLSRSYCTICHKELCNKYFMRTHMLKMHGISIESSTGLGGVTCDICNKELCSKYFLKVHKQNTHGIMDEGPSPPAEPPGTTPPPPPPPTTQQSSNNEPGPLDLHAASEGCPICSKRFRSVKWLKNHLLTDHGQEGRDAWKVTKKSSGLSPKSNNNKPRSRGSRVRNGTPEDEIGSQRMILDPLSLFFGKLESGDGGSGSGRVYRCNFCPFTTTLLVYHYAHERTHTGLGSSRIQAEPAPTNNSFQCPMCFQGVGSLEAFQQHLFSHGLLPPFLPPPSPAHVPSTTQLAQLTSVLPSSKARNNKNQRVTERRKRKRIIFRCSACKLSFGERAECLGHVKRDHHHQGRRRGKDQKLFRCRKCSFTSPTYAKWRVHFKVHHDRPAKMFEVLGGGSGVVLQRFLLGVGEGEPFVPSLVYLPVRAKVSECREVSFSLTPRS